MLDHYKQRKGNKISCLDLSKNSSDPNKRRGSHDQIKCLSGIQIKEEDNMVSFTFLETGRGKQIREASHCKARYSPKKAKLY